MADFCVLHNTRILQKKVGGSKRTCQVEVDEVGACELSRELLSFIGSFAASKKCEVGGGRVMQMLKQKRTEATNRIVSVAADEMADPEAAAQHTCNVLRSVSDVSLPSFVAISVEVAGSVKQLRVRPAKQHNYAMSVEFTGDAMQTIAELLGAPPVNIDPLWHTLSDRRRSYLTTIGDKVPWLKMKVMCGQIELRSGGHRARVKASHLDNAEFERKVKFAVQGLKRKMAPGAHGDSDVESEISIHECAGDDDDDDDDTIGQQADAHQEGECAHEGGESNGPCSSSTDVEKKEGAPETQGKKQQASLVTMFRNVKKDFRVGQINNCRFRMGRCARYMQINKYMHVYACLTNIYVYV